MSPTLVIDTSMERSSRVATYMETQKKIDSLKKIEIEF